MLSPAPFKLMNSAFIFNFDEMAKEMWGLGGSRDDDYVVVVVVVQSFGIWCVMDLFG